MTVLLTGTDGAGPVGPPAVLPLTAAQSGMWSSWTASTSRSASG
jgi:hypothetical protein